MLIKLTNYCSMGCNHCSEHSTVKGEHMTEDVFRKSLALTERLEGLAWSQGVPPRNLISGGECTEHPQFLRFLDISREINPHVGLLIITNGSWLEDLSFQKELCERPNVEMVQVTNDPKFYPTAVATKNILHPKVFFVPRLTALIHLGRHTTKKTPEGYEETKYPKSYNLRALTRENKDVRKTLLTVRARASLGMSGNCYPNIDDKGVLRAGESNQCWPIGDVDSSAEEVTKNLMTMGSCNVCGLETNLTPQLKRQIGLSTLYGPGE
jgi:hypothetical protein